MSYQFPADIEAMMQQQLASGYYSTPDDVLRAALVQLDDQDEDLRAIQESLDDLANGDEGVPLQEAFAAIRNKYNIPADK